MKKYKLTFKYVYTFYSFDEEVDADVRSESFDLGEGDRFTLTDQEDSAFHITSVGCDQIGEYVVLTFPNKDSIVIHAGEVCEFAYDEFFDAMGDSNHNVYEGTVEMALA